MNERSFRENLAPLAAAGLLILTAWGNALAMFVVGAVGLLVALFVWPKASRRKGALIAALGGVVGLVVALVMLKQMR
jgi:hypothetical protein